MMPLYLEILDPDVSATESESAFQVGPDAIILSRWTSGTTGKQVRLVDAPDELPSPRAAVRFVRIVCF